MPRRNFSTCTVGKGQQKAKGGEMPICGRYNSTFCLGAGIFIHAFIQQTHTDCLLGTKPKELKVGSALSFPILGGRQSNIQMNGAHEAKCLVHGAIAPQKHVIVSSPSPPGNLTLEKGPANVGPPLLHPPLHFLLFR